MALSEVRWILDDGPFGSLCRVVSPEVVSNWPACSFSLASATAYAARRDKSGRRQAVLSAAADAGAVDVLEIEMGSSAFEMLYEHLRPGSEATGDLAEHEAIAWAHEVEPTGVVVIQDRRAALTALAELGRCRVAHPFEFWEELHTAGTIGTPELNRLIDETRKEDTGLPGPPWRLRESGSSGIG